MTDDVIWMDLSGRGSLDILIVPVDDVLLFFLGCWEDWMLMDHVEPELGNGVVESSPLLPNQDALF